MKKLITLLSFAVTMVLGSAVCSASIIPAQGFGQIGLSSVVLCDSLSLHKSADSASESVKTLKYGDRIIVMEQSNGWAHVVLGDAEDSPSGWVNASYIAIDPAWYQTDDYTSVYAWNDTSAPKVALLDKGTSLPILRDDGDWLIVSLRGATGWINNPNRTNLQNNNAAGNSDSSAGGAVQVEGDSPWITVYAKDGSTVSVRKTSGSMYEDANGRTYVKQDSDGYYDCIETGVTYAFDPTAWTGEAYGENEFPNEYDDDTDEYTDDYNYNDNEDDEYDDNEYGDNKELTGEDYGENATLTGEDYGENEDYE